MAPIPPLLGHHHQRDDLERDLLMGNVSHAYLFLGPPHIGKFTVARWFAQQLLLTGVPDEEREQTIHMIDRLLHSDLLVLDQLWMEETQEDADVIAQSTNITQSHRIKAGSKTDTISIDDIRALQARLHEIPVGKYRVCLIRSVERMQDEAVNALLKILEEPPQGLVFILTAAAETLVLPTLLSRTRRLSFGPLAVKELFPLVAGLDAEEQQFLLYLAQGAPGVIERLKNEPDLLREAQGLATNARSFWDERSLTNKLIALTPLHERGADADAFLVHLLLAMRSLPPARRAELLAPVLQLLRGLQTNVSRPLLCEQFALSV